MENQENQNLYYQFSVEDTIDSLKTRKDGLTQKEVEERVALYGKNKLDAVNKTPLIFTFLYQFKDLMVMILIVAGSLSWYLGEYRDMTIMYVLVLINAIIGFVQEFKAEKMMDSLKNLVKAKAKVIREGKTIEIDGEDLVPGDVVILEEGDAPPADVRIFQENELATNDFSLTGESNPTRKFIHPIPDAVQLGDRNNIAFMGTTIATGNGLGVAIATGMHTEIGRIANLSQQTEDELSPLQKELNSLAKSITKTVLVIASLLFLIGLFLEFSLRESFLFALGVAASCVPEGLPAQVSVALSLASGRLAKQNAVVKKLSAVETLGSTHIICTDKTGTLTKNEMTVLKIVIGNKTFDTTGIGYEPKGNILDETGKPLSSGELEKYMLFFENGIFSSNAKVSAPDREHLTWYCIGDPTEAALVTLSEKAGVSQKELDRKHPEFKEFTFDAVRKRMTSVRNRDGHAVAYVKGAPQSLLDRCTKLWDGEKVRDITDKDREFIKQKDDEFAGMALRNLGYAYREVPEYTKDMKMDDVERNLIWLGLACMIDPPRTEVKAAMEAAIKAHIRVIIITGDYALTAEAIAKKIGLSHGKSGKITVVTGQDLQKFSDIDLLKKLISENLIFARTSPEDKMRIVRLLKKAGEVVAVTGDGVNDAPALKMADIGVSMGKTGTEVAKDSSEIVLLDDSFATLVTAISEGRTIFHNLKKTIMSSLTSNGGELFAVLLSLAATGIFHTPLAILAVQILAVDLVGEMLPLTFLTWDPSQPKMMTEPPRNPHEHIINKRNLIDLAWAGFLMGALGFANFLFLFEREGVSSIGMASTDPLYMRATTLTYITIVLVQWTNILSRRCGTDSVFSSYLWSNKRLLIFGYGISIFFLLNICYNPYISPFLSTAPITVTDWGFALLASAIYLGVRETYKIFLRRANEAKEAAAVKVVA